MIAFVFLKAGILVWINKRKVKNRKTKSYGKDIRVLLYTFAQ